MKQAVTGLLQGQSKGEENLLIRDFLVVHRRLHQNLIVHTSPNEQRISPVRWWKVQLRQARERALHNTSLPVLSRVLVTSVRSLINGRSESVLGHPKVVITLTETWFFLAVGNSKISSGTRFFGVIQYLQGWVVALCFLFLSVYLHLFCRFGLTLRDSVNHCSADSDPPAIIPRKLVFAVISMQSHLRLFLASCAAGHVEVTTLFWETSMHLISVGSMGVFSGVDRLSRALLTLSMAQRCSNTFVNLSELLPHRHPFWI